MIAVERLSKAFGKLRAVDRISFTVPRGELFGFLGPNGAGKTTAINMISGLLRPDEGTVFIEGTSVWDSPRRAKRLLGLVPQDVALYEEFNARENLHFWGGLYGLSRSELRRNTDELLHRVGLAGRAREPVDRYSGGMKRRLNLAIGLVHKPKVLLLDEPTVGIDPQARNSILDIIREIAYQGTTIIFTTHHLEEAEKLCDRIAVIDHGRILEMGSVEELAQGVGDHEFVALKGDFTADQLRRCLEGRPVSILTLRDGSASLSLLDDGDGIGSLVSHMSRAGIEVTEISIQKPTLETVFLKLTGRELRD